MELLEPISSDGEFTWAKVRPATVSDLAAALDPKSAYVLLPDFPLVPAGDGWQEVHLPLTPQRAWRPSPASVRCLTTDLLLNTDDFLNLAAELGNVECRLMQFRKLPRADGKYKNLTRMRKAELTISIEPLESGGEAVIKATDRATLTAALNRLN